MYGTELYTNAIRLRRSGHSYSEIARLLAKKYSFKLDVKRSIDREGKAKTKSEKPPTSKVSPPESFTGQQKYTNKTIKAAQR